MCFLYSGRIRTLVAMATSIFYRLIMGKVKIDIFFCLNGVYLGITVFKFVIWGGISSDILAEILFYGDTSAEP